MTKRPTRPVSSASAGDPRPSGGGRARLPTGVVRPKDEHSLEARARKFRNGEGFLVPPDSARPPPPEAAFQPPPVTASAAANGRPSRPLEEPSPSRDGGEDARGSGLIPPRLITALGMLALVIGIGIALAYVLFHPATYPVDTGTRTVDVPKSRETLPYDLAKRPTPEIRGAWRRLDSEPTTDTPAPQSAAPSAAPEFMSQPKSASKDRPDPILVERPTLVAPPEPKSAQPAARTTPAAAPPVASTLKSPETAQQATPAAPISQPQATAQKQPTPKAQPTPTIEPPKSSALPTVADRAPAIPTRPVEAPKHPEPATVAAPSPASATTVGDDAASRDVATDPAPNNGSGQPDTRPEGVEEPPVVATGSLPASQEEKKSAPEKASAERERPEPKRAQRAKRDRRQVKRPAGKVAKINRSEPASPRTSLDGPGQDVYDRTFGGFARVRP